jgi:predicted thioredoxin/glutaredoxin
MDEQILKDISEKELELYKKISDKMIKNIREMV